MNNQSRRGFIKTIIKYLRIDAEYYGYPIIEIDFDELSENDLEVLYKSLVKEV